MEVEELKEAQAEDVTERFKDGVDAYWSGEPGPDGWDTPEGWRDPFVAGWNLAADSEHQQHFYREPEPDDEDEDEDEEDDTP